MKRKALLQLAGILTAAVLLPAGCGPAAAVTVSITPHTAEMEIGETRVLSASASDGSALTWSSEDEAVVSVDGGGKVTALSAGQAAVVASAAVGTARAECRITVLSPAPSVDPPEGPEDPVDPVDPPTPAEPQWTLVWSDEFSAPFDGDKWEIQRGIQDDYFGTKGPLHWGNNEQQYYTEDAISVQDGALVITATREEMPDGRKYSSARITTRDRFSFTYGYAEARIKTPAITGMWPAFWALPQPDSHRSTQNKYGGWPMSGEIDIMEARGRQKNVAGATLHFGGGAGSWQSTYLTRDVTLSSSTEEWHTYGVDRCEEYIAWYYDGREVFRVGRDEYWTGAVSKEQNPNAPFDVPFYLLLNLAVGGNFDGGREPPADFTSAAMYVDYVRVYEWK